MESLKDSVVAGVVESLTSAIVYIYTVFIL